MEQQLRGRTISRPTRLWWAAAAALGELAIFLIAPGLLTAGKSVVEDAAAPRGSQLWPYHPYDPSAPELMARLPVGLREWNREDVERELRVRVGIEMRRRELDVNYYRIGFTIAYPLPLAASPKMADLPVGIRGITYPWYTWLSWSLEERWRLLHFAWRKFGDREAGGRLQKELAALARWDQSCEFPGSASLGTAHISGCLAQALAVSDGWAPVLYEKARSAAGTILERDVWPWFNREWPEGREITARELQNIRVITLARSAELARITKSPMAEALGSRTRQALRAWFRLRLAGPPYNEGSAYDGFLMDSLTGWLAGEPDREALLNEGRDAFASQTAQWLHLALPGRLDIQAPLGDVEPEMPFWMTALNRLATWYGWEDSAWLVSRLPAAVMPAALLVEALESGGFLKSIAQGPSSVPQEHPHAATLRTGWGAADLLAAVGLTRTEVGHLHTDAGQVVVGWQGRFWITDPGYQQYRPGVEREFSIGPEAHNLPRIAGKIPSRRAPRLVSLSGSADGGQRVVIDLSGCYQGLPAAAAVEREVRLVRSGPYPPDASVSAAVVRDRFRNLGPGTEVETLWVVGTHLAGAVRDGWARLSDGEHALWIGVFPGTISAASLDRHEGSRGPFTLRDKTVLPEGTGDRFWIFVCDPDLGWAPPVEKTREIIRNWN